MGLLKSVKRRACDVFCWRCSVADERNRFI